MPKNVDWKVKTVLSAICGFSGTSGKQLYTQEWTSARLKLPLRARILKALKAIKYFPTDFIELLNFTDFLQTDRSSCDARVVLCHIRSICSISVGLVGSRKLWMFHIALQWYAISVLNCLCWFDNGRLPKENCLTKNVILVYQNRVFFFFHYYLRFGCTVAHNSRIFLYI